jgi:ABC-type dipeptide/oligopeptide/nickel transport system permease subunit
MSATPERILPSGAVCATATPPRVSPRRVAVQALLRRKLFMGCAIFVVLLVIVAIFAPWVAPYPPNQLDLTLRLAPPSPEHWLGTDTVGRDTLSRIIYGSRVSLLVGIVAVAFSTLIGVVLGTLAGYFGGWTEAVIMRCMDALMTIPMILFALTLAALLGGGLTDVVVAIGLSMIPPYARLMCAQTQSIKQKDFVISLRSMGAGSWRVMASHVVPNGFSHVLVFMTMQIGAAILAEAALSFLGIGVPLTIPTWGSMVADGYPYIFTDPLLSIAPGVAIMATVFAFNMIGDNLRDVLDPRLRGSLLFAEKRT